jgi:hypothetical protein
MKIQTIADLADFLRNEIDTGCKNAKHGEPKPYTEVNFVAHV